jgi:hypothetical protein
LLAEVAIEGSLHGGTKLIERGVLGLLRGGTEFLSKITKNLILEGRLAWKRGN